MTTACLIGVLALLAACGGGESNEKTDPVLPAQEILVSTSKRLAETRSLTFRLNIEGETYIDDNREIRLLGATGDLVRPDRVRTSFKAKVRNLATVSIQLIVIGETTWSTDLVTGQWGPAPDVFEYNPGVLFDTKQGIGPVIDSVTDGVRQPDETIDGQAAYRIQAQVTEEVIGPLTSNTMAGSPVTIDFWVAVDTLDLLRVQLQEPASAERQDPATWTLELMDHGKKISIEPPVED